MAFPLNPKKSTSGIIVDPQTLERVVPPTKRSDGTARKSLKIRPGYTPAEDIQKYRSSGSKDTARLKGYVPGASSSSSSTYQAPPELSSNSAFPALGSGMTKAQKKNMARRNKKNADKEEEDARNWDSDEEEDGKDNGAKPVEEDKVLKKSLPVEQKKAPKSALSGIQSTLQSLRIDEPASVTAGSPTSQTSTKKSAETVDIVSSHSTKPSVRPGGGLFRDLPIKSKDQPSAATATATASPSLPSQPPETQPPSEPKPQGTKTPPSGQPRTRPEVRVRPGGGLQGLQGLVRQIAAESEGRQGGRR